MPTDISVQVSLPGYRLTGLPGDRAVLIRQGYHLTVHVSDVSVLGPEKYEALLG